MRIVQRKASNKVGIQSNSKKTRTMTGSELEGGLRSCPKGRGTPRQPGKPPPLVSPPSPSKTPSPKKPINLKSSYASPNYMKSTSSSEARQERGKGSSSSSEMVQRVSKGVNRSSSLKKVRTLTKAPSFKHTRLGGNKCSKVVFCENLVVQRATCSSTLKDSKFPPYLVLNPGATEAEGTSAMKVCPYNYCSLNGHHHKPVPPLKSFLSSRRRLLKTQRVVRTEVITPRKAKVLQKDVKGVDYEDEVIFSSMPVKPEIDQKDGFFVEIYVANNEDTHSKIDSEDGLDQSEGNISADDPQTPQLIKADDSASVSLDGFLGENSDMEWEEGQFGTAHLENQSDISEHSVDRNDPEEPDLKSDEAVSGDLEGFMVDKQLLPYSQEEIVEWLYFSDVGSMPDSETTQSDESQNGNPNMIDEGDGMDSSIEDDQTISSDELEVDPTSEEGTEEYHSYMYADEENHGDGANIENKEEEFVMESTENFLQEIENFEDHSLMGRSLKAVNHCQAQSDDKEADKADEEEDYPTTFKLHSYDECFSDIKAPEMEGINEVTEVDGFPVLGNETRTGQIQKDSYCRKGADPREELLGNCLKLKKSMRREKEDEEKEDGEFNPRGPNFLPIEPDPEEERVDLRHQEMDERRNSEEWMLDYALQRTVNQLAPARKRKVALLVEAFESVLPITKCEPHLKRASSGFAHSRPIQACS